MSKTAADLADDAKVRLLAEDTVHCQESEMNLMADMLAKRGAKA